MDVFGITPVDSSLSAAGLHLSQAVQDFLFRQSKIGYLVFVIGLLLSLWQCAKSASYGRLLRHLAMGIGCLLLIAMPVRVANSISSFQEEHGTVPLISAQGLRTDLGVGHEMPVLLSFAGQSVDSFINGCVSAFSIHLPSYARFLEHPFKPQNSSLSLHEEIRRGITAQPLKGRVQDFVYAWYLPALTRLRQENASAHDLSLYGPSHENITAFYSDQAREEWNTFKTQIKQEAQQRSAVWVLSVDDLNSFFNRSASERTETDLIDALAQTEARAGFSGAAAVSNKLWDWARMGLSGYFYVQGGANLCLYLFFPLVLCLVLAFARLDLFLIYLKSFLWIKSFSLTAALACLISIAGAQAGVRLHTQGIQWFWQEPNFVLSAAVLAYTLPLLTGFLLFKGRSLT